MKQNRNKTGEKGSSMQSRRAFLRRSGSVALAAMGASACSSRTSPLPAPSRPDFYVWATSCCHVPADLRNGRESLATAIRQSDGRVDGAPGFDWDINVDCGDLSSSQFPPTDEEGSMVVEQYRALSRHDREQVYNVIGNHDGNYYDDGEAPWFRKWGDPMGESTRYSEVDSARRPFPVLGTWERYRFQAGNLLFLMLSDRNDMPNPVGRGHSRDRSKGGFPAGSVTRETFDWWKRQVMENRDKIIITVHHNVLRDTTTASGYNEAGGYHGSSGGGEGSSYLYFTIENTDPDDFRFTVSKPGSPGPFEEFLDQFYMENGKPAIDLWIGGHTHVRGPEDTYGGKSITEQKWGVTFLQVSALTKYQYHRSRRGRHPMSRLLTFTDGVNRLKAEVYVHDDSFGDHPAGFYGPASRSVQLRHRFQTPGAVRPKKPARIEVRGEYAHGT